MQVNAMSLQKGMHFHPGLETQHLPQCRFRKEFRAVALQGQRFKGDSRWVFTLSSHLTGKLVRDIESNLHTVRIA